MPNCYSLPGAQVALYVAPSNLEHIQTVLFGTADNERAAALQVAVRHAPL
jgi:hypothetical protein